MSENVKDKVKQVLGLMGICPDYPVRLYCSFIAPRSTGKEPVNRDFLEIPDEWVAKVADRITELEVEIAQLKAQINIPEKRETDFEPDQFGGPVEELRARILENVKT